VESKIKLNMNSKLKPLQNVTIVLTRSKEQTEESIKLFEDLGANVVGFPTVEYIPVENKAFDNFFVSKKKFDYLILTSANAVTYFFEKLSKLKVKLNRSEFKIVVTGKGTAKILSDYGFKTDIMPNEFSAKGIIKELSKYDFKNKTVVIPHSKIGRDELTKKLNVLGGVVKAFDIYDVTLPKKRKYDCKIGVLNKSKIDWFIFTSPSTFKNFLKIMNLKNINSYFLDKKIAVIGPTTKSEVVKSGLSIELMAEEYTMDGIVKSLINFYK
jgi:uroporphyrinogen-III synthase